MKQFLRYQISGTVFLIWISLFSYSSLSGELINYINKNNISLSNIIALAVAFAMPFGVLIHQVSVMIKNWILPCILCTNEFNDYPKKKYLQNTNEHIKYLRDKISSLNSYYFVRVDNGVLAPLFAWLIVAFLLQIDINIDMLYAFIFIAILMIIYIPRLGREIKLYKKLILKEEKKLKKPQINED